MNMKNKKKKKWEDRNKNGKKTKANAMHNSRNFYDDGGNYKLFSAWHAEPREMQNGLPQKLLIHNHTPKVYNNARVRFTVLLKRYRTPSSSFTRRFCVVRCVLCIALSWLTGSEFKHKHKILPCNVGFSLIFQMHALTHSLALASSFNSIPFHSSRSCTLFIRFTRFLFFSLHC